MASLRHVRGQNLAEQNRVRSLARKGATLAGTSEEELLERVENALRKSQIRLHDLEGDRGQTELALWFLCTYWSPIGT